MSINVNIEKTMGDFCLKTKFDAELEVWRGISEGLNAVIVNPGVIVGSGFWKRGSGAFITQISRGMNYYPSGKTGFICVKDVVKIMKDLMNKNIFLQDVGYTW